MRKGEGKKERRGEEWHEGEKGFRRNDNNDWKKGKQKEDTRRTEARKERRKWRSEERIRRRQVNRRERRKKKYITTVTHFTQKVVTVDRSRSASGHSSVLSVSQITHLYVCCVCTFFAHKCAEGMGGDATF